MPEGGPSRRGGRWSRPQSGRQRSQQSHGTPAGKASPDRPHHRLHRDNHPEAVVSVTSALSCSPNMTTGNALVGCSFNIMFILGIAAIIHSVKLSRSLLRTDMPLYFVALASLALLVNTRDGPGMTEGVILLVCNVVFLVVTGVRGARGGTGQQASPMRSRPATREAWGVARHDHRRRRPDRLRCGATLRHRLRRRRSVGNRPDSRHQRAHHRSHGHQHRDQSPPSSPRASSPPQRATPISRSAT